MVRRGYNLICTSRLPLRIDLPTAYDDTRLILIQIRVRSLTSLEEWLHKNVLLIVAHLSILELECV